MQSKTSTKETLKEQENAMSQMSEQAVKNCEQALRSGLKLQQEVGQWWTHLIDQGASAEDWQKRLSAFKPTTQKRLEEVLDLAAKNTRVGTELFQKAAEAVNTSIAPYSQGKWMEFWTAWMGAVNSNAQALTELRLRTVESWMSFVQKNADLVAQSTPSPSRAT
jgi:hypothetical protein